MKKRFLLQALFLIFGTCFAKGYETKGNFILGVNPVSCKYDSEYVTDFDSAYACADIITSTDYLTAGGKFYYRLSLSDDKNDINADKTLSQKIDLKRAFLRVRPFGTNFIEISGGKLYSYYLPGNYFQLSEIYTGVSRWGKTGLGIKFETAGFTFGAALPVTESYAEFSNSFGAASAFGYDFRTLNKNIPLKLNSSYHYEYSYSEKQSKKTDPVVETEDINHRFSVSANYAPSVKGFFSKINTTLTYSYNAQSFAAHTTFKNVSNYSEIGDAWFFSVNHRNTFGPVDFILEGEGGKTLNCEYVPLYFGTQFLIPITKNFAFKPRFYYYGGINLEDSERSRTTYEWYPRLWVTSGQFIISAGYDFSYKQTEDDGWKWEWSVPLYVEYKMKK